MGELQFTFAPTNNTQLKFKQLAAENCVGTWFDKQFDYIRISFQNGQV